MRERARAAHMPPVRDRVRGAERSPSPRQRAGLVRPSSRRGTGPLPNPKSAGAEKATRARRARHPSSPAYRSFQPFEMAGVVDAGDDEAAVAFLDDGDGGVLDAKRKKAVIRAADHPMQSDLDDPSVSHRQHVSVLV